MGWAHATVAMEEVLGLVRGFVGVLVLAGGCTSSGAAATWSSDEVKKALRWALFFEEVFKDLRESGHYEDSAGELDAALAELTSNPEFPKGLVGVRSETLSTARLLVIRHFLKVKAMSVENFAALLEAVVEMDIDGICASGVHNACHEYAESVLVMNSSCATQIRNGCDIGPLYAESMVHSRVLVKEFLEGLDSASCSCLAERGLGTLLNSVKKNSLDDASNNLCASPIPKTTLMIEEFLVWKQWRAKCFSYLLEERTIRILSGANLIFKAPKEQWMKVFEPLKSFEESCQKGLVEIMELCFLGLISRRWNPLIEGFMSHSFCFVPISKQYTDLHQLLQGTSQDKCQDKLLDLEEKDILEYASQSLRGKPSILWVLPPVLTAAAIPPWSTLFQIYLTQIDKQLHGAPPADRKCCCRGDGIDQHHNCDITERIRCLHTFHIQQPCLTVP
ncbi:unnamed protein product [Urochloa humidicola]